MASPANRMSYFTITQPFLGAPLHFQPALGSQELEALIDAYVAGPASKQDKLSEVTIDFYNHATVDLTNGSLVRRYEVIVPSRVAGQSPTQSQSSGFSPIYTPSPGSSATFGDSGNASASMTPPNRCRHSRLSKKAAKKETKRAAELRLPGFSIMTKDGVDVTSSAGRGTKTKEQREHAHMMRIMKACEDCKRKKVRCDPSHRRSNNGSSAASTGTTTSKTYSPAQQNPSPASSGPPLSRAFASGSSTGDFILFPENDSAWNSADLSPSEFDGQACDLTNFDFQIGGIDLNEFTILNEDDAFDWSFTQPDFAISGYSRYNPVSSSPYSLEQWVDLEGLSPISRANQASMLLRDSVELSSKTYTSSVPDVNTTDRSRPDTLHWPDYFAESPDLSLSSGSGSLDGSLATISSSSNTASLDRTPGATSGAFSSYQPSQTDASSPDASQLITGNTSQNCSKKRLYSQALQASTNEHAAGQCGRSPASIDSLDRLTPASDQILAGSLHDHNLLPRVLRDKPERVDLEHACCIVAGALKAIKAAPDEHLSLSSELGRLRRHLHALKRSYSDNFCSGHPDTNTAVVEDLASKLQVLVTRVKRMLQSGRLTSVRYSRLDPENRLQQRLWQVNCRRLIRALCATITNLEALKADSSPSTGNTRILTSRYNRQLLASPDDRHSHGVRLTATPLRLDFIALPVLDVPSMNVLPGFSVTGLDIQKMDIPERSRQYRTEQLEIAGLVLPIVMLASLIAASLTNLTTAAQLGAQVFLVIVATGSLLAGHSPFASSTATLRDHPPTPSIFSRTTVPPLSFLSVAAALLPLSTRSSGSLARSSKHASSKHLLRLEASHWFGMLKLNLGSRVF